MYASVAMGQVLMTAVLCMQNLGIWKLTSAWFHNNKYVHSVSVSENGSQNTIAISSPQESQDPEIQLDSYITHLIAIVSQASRGNFFFRVL